MFASIMTATLEQPHFKAEMNDKTCSQFDDLAKSRGRPNRASSLALPNHSLTDLLQENQRETLMFDNNSLTIPQSATTGRRHSSHYCPVTDDERIDDDDVCQVVKKPVKPQMLSLIPPPVPKRTFQGRLKQQKRINNFYSSIDQNRENFSDQNRSYSQYRQEKCRGSDRGLASGRVRNLSNYQLSRIDSEADSPLGPFKDGKFRFTSSVSSASFDDIDPDDIVLFNKKMQSLDSNQSSSDSNKSQTTIDTGYVSSNDNEKSMYTTASSIRSFRSRFSSEDTQSSLDSYMSSDLHRTDTTDSLQNNSTSDSPFIMKRSIFNFDTKTNLEKSPNRLGYCNSDDGRSHFEMKKSPTRNRRIPAVPARKNIGMPLKLQPMKPTPPPPPQRSQLSLDMSRYPQSEKKSSNFHQLKTDTNHFQEMYSQPLSGSRQKSTSNNSDGDNILSTCKLTPPPPPPSNQIHHTKVNQRQDSNISSDSYSMTSSPGYNSKNMEIPLLQNVSKIKNHKIIMQHQESNDNNLNINAMMKNKNVGGNSNNNNNNNSNNNGHNNTNGGGGGGGGAAGGNGNGNGGRKINRINIRQDSTISSDSVSQKSSPGYNTKMMEAPLLANAVKLHSIKQVLKHADDISKEIADNNANTAAIIKSASTPASLQTIVRLSNGSNMSLQHKILKARKNSNPYVTRGRLKFRLCQILLNAIALLAIAGGLAAYFNAYPTVKFINKTIISPQRQTTTTTDDLAIEDGKNPAPGVCLPVIVKFCLSHKLSYNFTVFPNYIGHFGQPEAQVELDAYDALVDVQCYELVPLFLCSLFVPKCGSTGSTVPPCRSLCAETMRRCGFFFDVFGLDLPEYLTCNLFTESQNADECVGSKEVREAQKRARKPVCNEFLCDGRRCIPSMWRCDGHVDCEDQSDESHCTECGPGFIHCGNNKCMSQKHVCDGVIDCPWGQDERNCIRLAERNGDVGRGMLEIYKADKKRWIPACAAQWDNDRSPTMVCSMLGYNAVNSSRLFLRGTNQTYHPIKDPSSWRNHQRKHMALMKEFSNCPVNNRYAVVELTCSNFVCGKVRKPRSKPSLRIIGGKQSNPGDWPFLAAILGGPEEVFYCAGVLISDQWILTASHCIGNHTLRQVNDWTIQLGITRRHSHSHYGQKVKVKHVIPHPQYNSLVAHDNDIALFQLATRVAFHEHLLPVCLPPANIKELKPGMNCTVIGWGKREDKTSNPGSSGNTYEPAVNEVQVPILPRDLCNDWLEMLNVTDGMICAGYQEGGKDACQGDSGGPLLCPHPDEKDRWFVGGIVSWGIMCAHPKLPGVYANVPKYIPWILQQIQNHSTAGVADFYGR